MIILNDIVTFEPADIAQLSPGLQAAFDAYVGTAVDDQGKRLVTRESFLSARVNEHLEAAKRAFAKPQLDALIPLAEAISVASDINKMQAQDLLDQAAATVGVVIIKPPIAAEPPIETAPAEQIKP